MLFFDGDGDGKLTLVEGHPDADGSGALEADEDFPLQGIAVSIGSDDRYWQPTALLQAALSRGVFTEDDWPAHIPTVSEASAFWGAMSAQSIQQLAAARPDLDWMVTASWTDHGIPQCSRPHVVGLYEDLRRAGAAMRLNPSIGSLAALSEANLRDYQRLPAGAALSEATVQRWLPPDKVQGILVREAGILDILALQAQPR